MHYSPWAICQATFPFTTLAIEGGSFSGLPHMLGNIDTLK